MVRLRAGRELSKIGGHGVDRMLKVMVNQPWVFWSEGHNSYVVTQSEDGSYRLHSINGIGEIRWTVTDSLEKCLAATPKHGDWTGEGAASYFFELVEDPRPVVKPQPRKHNRFAYGSGVYVCQSCGRRTRETGDGAQNKLCEPCWDLASYENEASDYGLTTELHVTMHKLYMKIIGLGGKLGKDVASWVGIDDLSVDPMAKKATGPRLKDGVKEVKASHGVRYVREDRPSVYISKTDAFEEN